MKTFVFNWKTIQSISYCVIIYEEFKFIWMIYYFLDVSISARHLTELPKKTKKQYNTFFYYNQIVFCFVIAYNTAENIEIIFYSLLNKQKGTPK
jgi:hypothetical protein